MAKTPLTRRKRLSPVSKRRALENVEYQKRKAAYLKAHPICEFWLAENGFTQEYSPELFVRLYAAPRSTEIHHKRKPRSKYLNDESTWMAVSRPAHDWIERHKDLARAKGYLYDNGPLLTINQPTA